MTNPMRGHIRLRTGRALLFRVLTVALWAGIAAGMLPSCSYKSRNILFKQERYNEFYKAERKLNKPVIRRKTDEVVGPYRLAVADQVRVQYVNVCEPLLTELARQNAASGSSAVAAQSGTSPVSTSTGNTSAPSASGFTYTIDQDGALNLPLIGRFKAKGLSIRQLRDTIEARLVQFCPATPTVEVQVPSLRAFLFNEGGAQTVVQLRTERVTLPEFLAQSGGLQYFARAKKIQIFRGDMSDPQVIWVDMQNLDALKDLNLFVLPNDLVYIEPRTLPRIGRDIQAVSIVFSAITLVTSIILLTRL